MGNYQYYLFDLDGTLTDSGEGIMNSIRHALHKFGITEYEETTLRKFIGPPLAECFQKYFDLSPEEARKGIDYYREYYTDGGMFENEVYHGVKELLEGLNAKGKTLIVATSKPELFAEQILEHFDLRKYFDLVGGADMDETRVKKGEVISYTLKRLGADKSEDRILMIGDRKHDIIGAHENGIPCAGVLYGYGSREEFDEAGADVQVETVKELEKYILDFMGNQEQSEKD